MWICNAYLLRLQLVEDVIHNNIVVHTQHLCDTLCHPRLDDIQLDLTDVYLLQHKIDNN